MNYLTLIQVIKESSLKEPNIKTVIDTDLYQLNTLPNINYSAVVVLPKQVTVLRDYVRVELLIYYIDRIDETGYNSLYVQNTGIQLLTNIINRVVKENDIETDDTISYIPFIHKFKDNCSGVYASVTFELENDLGDCYYTE